MQGRKTIKILATVTILVIICVAITYVKSDNKVVLATTKEFNSENLQENEHMHIEEDASEDKVPVPNGYVGSKATGENEIDTGYVIYEGTEEVNNSNVEEAQKTRNQYVWIPVPDASTMYGTDEKGRMLGKTYTFTMNTGSNIDEETGAKPSWSESNGIMQWSDEPNIALKKDTNVYDMDSSLKGFSLKEKETHKFLIQMEKEFRGMIESVEKYGGFYIGRYETGNLNKNKVVVQKENTNISGQTWYDMYDKCRYLQGANKNVATGLIWKCQFDRTLMWLIETGNKSRQDICQASSKWGNYKNSTFEYGTDNTVKESGITKIIPTGSSEYTIANNIYDLAGNVAEWTMATGQSFYRAYVGGNYFIEGNVNSASYYYPNGKLSYGGCRAGLYIKC